jgi:hypothetical protein
VAARDQDCSAGWPEAGTRQAPPEPPSGGSRCTGTRQRCSGKAGTGLLARPVRLTLGGLIAALESVVEEGRLGFAGSGMCGRGLIFEAAIGGEAELCVGVRPEEVDQALEGWGRVVQDQARG